MPNYKMTRQLIIYLTILLSACGQKNGTNETLTLNKATAVSIDSLQPFSITNATADDFLNAKKVYIDHTLYDTTAFKKNEGKIKLPINEKWRPFVIFTDTLPANDETGVREYKYLGQFEKAGFYIVGGSFYEHYESYLVDKRTGSQTTIWNNPSISPTGKFIANLSMAYGLEGVPNGLQIWNIERQENNQIEPVTIQKYLELDQLIWVPDDFVWETDNSLILKVASVEKYINESGQQHNGDFYYLRLKLK